MREWTNSSTSAREMSSDASRLLPRGIWSRRMSDTYEQVFAAPEITNIRERVVVAPTSGKFHPRPPEVITTEGEWVDEGQVLAEIQRADAAVPVASAFSGWLMGMLPVAGQPVSA